MTDTELDTLDAALNVLVEIARDIEDFRGNGPPQHPDALLPHVVISDPRQI